MVPAPGFGSKDKMVKSKSGSTPHLITASISLGEVQYRCDDKCPQYKSVHICSHTVAAAEANGDLANFLLWFRRNCGKRSPNPTKLANHGMPAGADRKGGKVAMRKAVRKCAPTENRVPLNTTPVTPSNAFLVLALLSLQSIHHDHLQTHCIPQLLPPLSSQYTTTIFKHIVFHSSSLWWLADLQLSLHHNRILAVPELSFLGMASPLLLTMDLP